MFNQKTLLITGGTGSLGTAICKRLLNDPPKKLIVLSSDWHKQDKLKEELGDPSWMRFFIGNVRDYNRVAMAFEDADYVIHAAAIKSIDACEKEPQECLKTNVIGTENVVNAALAKGVKKILFVSTDKAVNPINTYGVSKLMAERLTLNANSLTGWKNIKFSVIRYGNVVGSNGSVVPKWRKLIDAGNKELPLTHEEMTRFWFPMDGAVEFVLNSLEKMQGNEVFIPRIPSARMVDVAAAFDKPYYITGIRKNEKLHEELDRDYNSKDNEYLSVEQIKETIKEWL